MTVNQMTNCWCETNEVERTLLFISTGSKMGNAGGECPGSFILHCWRRESPLKTMFWRHWQSAGQSFGRDLFMLPADAEDDAAGESGSGRTGVCSVEGGAVQ